MPRSTKSLAAALLAVNLLLLLAEAAAVPAFPGKVTQPVTFAPAKYLALAQLLGLGAMSLAVALRRGRHGGLWLVLAAGCFYLAAEAVLGFHETIETAVETSLQVADKRWTRRIDDVLVALGGAAGIAVLVWFRRELSRYGRARRWFAAGFAALVVGVLFDIATAQLEVFDANFGQTPATRVSFGLLELIENAILLAGEALLLVAVHWCYCLAVAMRDDRTSDQLTESEGASTAD